jgi:hypothetical protein
MAIIEKLKLNPKNPRTIRKEVFERLKKSLKEFPEMLKLRPIIYDSDYIVLGGNMRLRAIRELVNEGFEAKDEYFKCAEDLTEEQKRRFVIKDNITDGDWDFDILANEWSDLPLQDWGIDIPEIEEKVEPEVPFTEELMEEHNYIVLYFDNEIDWLNLQTIYPLPVVKTIESKEGYMMKGIGRVVKGTDFIEKIRK